VYPIERRSTRVKVKALALSLLILCVGARARALDKQGSAHGGSSEGGDEGFGVSGNVFAGSAIVNPTYAARPDNSGLVLFRFGGHADVDLIGRLLSIPLDVNMFTDRRAAGARIFVPSELDLIGGVTSTFGLGTGALELGVRGEHDMGVDRKTPSQSYIDARARYMYSLAETFGAPSRSMREDLTGWVTLGAFVVNPTYTARPDLTGLALLRYVLHDELTLFHGKLALAVDATFFTDRRTNVIRPSELDLTPGIYLRFEPVEVHLAYERDMPLDRGGLVQQFAYVNVAYSFEFKPKKHK
jgi:hypothetical protein